MPIRRRLSGIVIVLGILGGASALAVPADRHLYPNTRHLAGCSTCPRPPEQPY